MMKSAVLKAARALWRSTPIILGVVLLISLANTFVPKSMYPVIFQKGPLDPLLGAAIGSILTGTPITSYIIGGELLEQGVSLLAITAFLVAWVTVGLIQLPAEAMLLGRKFAVLRNACAFIFSVLVAFLTVILVNL